MAKKETLSMKEKKSRFLKAFKACGGNVTKAAKMVGISRRTATKYAGSQKCANFPSPEIKPYTVNDFDADINKAMEIAIKQGQALAVAKCAELKAKVRGLFVERHQVSGDVQISFGWGNNHGND